MPPKTEPLKRFRNSRANKANLETAAIDNPVLNLFDLTGTCALVTGATGGLGRSFAQCLHDAGAMVAIIGRSEKTAEFNDDRYLALRKDLCVASEPALAIEETISHFGRLDILVNAHGIVLRGDAENFLVSDWERILQTNLTAAFAVAQAAGRHFLKQKKGKIINIASMLSFSGGFRAAAYAASKGGIAQMTKALANEWAIHGVNVNAIAPGYFVTRMTEGLRNDPVRNQQILDRLPAGRWGQPEEMNGALLFLASKASDYVHGIILPIDGGWLSR